MAEIEMDGHHFTIADYLSEEGFRRLNASLQRAREIKDNEGVRWGVVQQPLRKHCLLLPPEAAKIVREEHELGLRELGLLTDDDPPMMAEEFLLMEFLMARAREVTLVRLRDVPEQIAHTMPPS